MITPASLNFNAGMHETVRGAGRSAERNAKVPSVKPPRIKVRKTATREQLRDLHLPSTYRSFRNVLPTVKL